MSYLTRMGKQKLCHYFVKEVCTLGQKMIVEGAQSDYIVLIKRGEFELTTTLYTDICKGNICILFLII